MAAGHLRIQKLKGFTSHLLQEREARSLFSNLEGYYTTSLKKSDSCPQDPSTSHTTFFSGYCFLYNKQVNMFPSVSHCNKEPSGWGCRHPNEKLKVNIKLDIFPFFIFWGASPLLFSNFRSDPHVQFCTLKYINRMSELGLLVPILSTYLTTNQPTFKTKTSRQEYQKVRCDGTYL